MTIKKIRINTMQSILYNNQVEIECFGLFCNGKDISLIYKSKDLIVYCTNGFKEVNSTTAKSYEMAISNFIKNNPTKIIACFDKNNTHLGLIKIGLNYNINNIYDLKTVIKLSVCPFEIPQRVLEYTKDFVFKKYYKNNFNDGVLDNTVGLILLINKFFKIIEQKNLQELLNIENNIDNIVLRLKNGEMELDKEYIKRMYKSLSSGIQHVRDVLGDKIINVNLNSKADMSKFMKTYFKVDVNPDTFSITTELERIETKRGKEKIALAKKVLFLRKAEYIYNKYVTKLLNNVIEKQQNTLNLNIYQNMNGIIKSNISEIEDITFKDLNGWNIFNTKLLLKHNENTNIVTFTYNELELRVILELSMQYLPKEKVPKMLKELYLDKNQTALEFLKGYSIGDTTDKDEDFTNFAVEQIINSFTYGATLYGIYHNKEIFDKLGAIMIEKLYTEFKQTLGDIENLKEFIQTNAEYYGYIENFYGRKFYFPAEYYEYNKNIPKIYITSLCSDIIKRKIIELDNYLLNKKSRIIGIDKYTFYIEANKNEKITKGINKILKKVELFKSVPIKIDIQEDEDLYKLNDKERFI